jgi:single-stranded-DNA-specific exonuclease
MSINPDPHIQVRPLPEAMPDLGELHPVLARLYAARGLSDPAHLEYSLRHLLPYQGLLGIGTAVELLVTALQRQQRVLIVGDFDVDGATSTALAMLALRQLGLGSVEYMVPDRFKYGYGLTPEIVAVAAKRQPDLIITVDNGISSLDGVAAANEQGISVLITDHHLAGATLPAAAAIVNPNQPGDSFPSKAIPGVGVIFYLMLALRARLRDLDWFEKAGRGEPNLATLLDLVALGIVADVVPLEYNNRIMVAQGLARVRARQCRPGILALLEVAGRDPARLVASDFGFCVAPRINAAGRLEDMSIGIECLLTDDPARARELAASLDRLNRERRGIEDRMRRDALDLVDSMQLDDARLPVGLCLFEEGWHEGVVGIVASRLKDRLHRPVIAFASTGDTDLKGSARSVKGVHIRDVLDAVATRHPGLISRFGGHAMAAGLSLKRANYAAFASAFDAEVRQHIGEDDLRGLIFSDGRLEVENFVLELAESIRTGGPWGQGFEEPQFDGEFVLINRRIVAEKHLKLTLGVPDSECLLDAIAFNTSDADWPADTTRIHAVYRLDVNEYRGRTSLQLIIQSLQPV